MRKYIIYRKSDDKGKVSVQVLKTMGYENGIPCYEHYRTMPERSSPHEPSPFERAADLIRRMESVE